MISQRYPEACSASDLSALAQLALARCDQVASYTEEPGRITRTFLSEPMRRLHQEVTGWMNAAGMSVHLDAAGNLIGRREGTNPALPMLMIGSHLDTVPDAGKYDGVLGVLLGLAAVQALGSRTLPFGIDLIAFSDEEGVRYRAPFLGSLAVCGRFDCGLLDRCDTQGVAMSQAFRSFGLDPACIALAAYPAGHIRSYLEVHIEQGPVLESLQAPVGVVQAIAGQSRLWITFQGRAGHAGTLPMQGRRDALAAAAELVLEVERLAQSVPELRATVGSIFVDPGAVNVVPGRARLSADVRHQHDNVRMAAVLELRARASALAARRGIAFRIDEEEHHPAVPADPNLVALLSEAVAASGNTPHRLPSGAGHDAAVMATVAPWAMLFIRSPGGASHSPDERVLPEDVEVALDALLRYLESLAGPDLLENGISSSSSSDPPGVS